MWPGNEANEAPEPHHVQWDTNSIAVTDHGKEVGVVDCGVAGMVGGLPAVEHDGDGQTKVGTKGVDEHGASHIGRLQDMDIQGLVG